MHLLKIFENFANHFFQIKQILTTKIILVEKREVACKNEEIATYLNNYFNDIIKGLNIEKWCISDKLSDDPLVNASRKYENHPSIM